jgi:two-component system chemotaxis sensor kinase CheA
MDDSDQVMLELIQESREHLENIEPDLLEMESLCDQTPPDLINKVFRAMHSIKGGFGFFNKTKIVSLAHVMENVLMRVRDGLTQITPEMIGALLDGVDTLASMVDDVNASEEMEIDHHIKLLQPFTEENKVDSKTSSEDQKNQGFEKIPQDQFANIKQLQEQGNVIYLVDVEDALEGECEAELNSVGQVIWKSEDLKVGLLDTVLDLDMLNGMGIAGISSIKEVPGDLDELATPSVQAAKQEKPAEQKTEPKPGSAKPSDAAPAKASPKTTDSIRVRTDLLSQLVDTAGEMVLGRNRVMDIIQKDIKSIPGFSDKIKKYQEEVEVCQDKLLETYSKSLNKDQLTLMKNEFQKLQHATHQIFQQKISEASGVGTVFQGFSRVSSELQNGIMGLRLQPVSAVFSKFPRVIRDMNKKLGKEIELVIEGEEVELDKTVIEGLGDPLTHLVRNSCDHGVETPDVRESKGKTRKGLVKLSALHEGGQVHIVIKDDGGGINVNRIKEKAVENGMMTAEEAEELPDKKAFKLIFAAGFSTAKEVSDVSGRGVGMDVVRTNIEKLGGRIEIDSAMDQGSTLTLILPLTLAIIPSLGVTAAGQHFAIPQVAIDELVRVSPDEVSEMIATVGGSPVLKLRNTLLSLVRLSDVLGKNKVVETEDGELIEDRRQLIHDRRSQELGRTEEANEETPDRGKDRRNTFKNRMYIVVLKSLGASYGLIVDQLHEPQEVVVKPLSKRLKSVEIFSGATIRSDGNVSMILDADGIVRDANIRLSQNMVETDCYEYANIHESQTMLEFTAGTADHFAVNLSMVSRVERVSPERIYKTGQLEFLQYEESSLRVIRLSDFLDINKPTEEPKEYFVLVPRLVSNPIGILIDKPSGVFETNHEIDCDKIQQVGIHGSQVIDSQLIMFLDLYSLFSKVDPENYKKESPSLDLSTKRVLFAEDTALFRSVISDFLRELKFSEVDVVCDGEEAWGKLQKQSYDLLVTDIVMPKMNGMELATNIRSNDSTKSLPIIAVTSLLNESDKKKILDSGVDIYQQKLDREGLFTSITELLGSHKESA